MDIDKICDVLNKDGLVIIPTDTVYGISADATNKEMAKKVNEAKRRKENKPLNILVSDKEMLKKYTKNISELEKQIMAKFMPGKLTMLFLKNDLISEEITANSPYVAIRIPDYEDLRCLIKKFGKPIISTSANITGSDVVSNLNNLENELKEKIDYICDIGELQTTPSTLIKVENNEIIILREGIIGSEIRKEFKNSSS